MTGRDSEAIAQAIETCDEVSRCRMGLLSACRQIVRLRPRLDVIPGAILDPIIGAESELDDVPDEAQKDLWATEAFKEQLRRRDEYLAQVQPGLLESFRRLRDHLATAGPDAEIPEQ